MGTPLDAFRSRIKKTATIQELEAIHSEMTVGPLSERSYTQLYYDLVAQRLLIIRQVRERASKEL